MGCVIYERPLFNQELQLNVSTLSRQKIKVTTLSLDVRRNSAYNLPLKVIAFFGNILLHRNQTSNLSKNPLTTAVPSFIASSKQRLAVNHFQIFYSYALVIRLYTNTIPNSCLRYDVYQLVFRINPHQLMQTNHFKCKCVRQYSRRIFISFQTFLFFELLKSVYVPPKSILKTELYLTLRKHNGSAIY